MIICITVGNWDKRYGWSDIKEETSKPYRSSDSYSDQIVLLFSYVERINILLKAILSNT
jgi:hypothetical protein